MSIITLRPSANQIGAESLETRLSITHKRGYSPRINSMTRVAIGAEKIPLENFQTQVVRLIRVEKKPDEALEVLSAHYRVEKPMLKMGLPKGENSALGCYVTREKTIYISTQEYLYDPYIIIHEFYHHLRSVTGKHRGTERHARDFALEFLRNEPRGGSTMSDFNLSPERAR